MANEFDNLGKASLDLTARTVEFERNITSAHKTAQGMESQLDALAAISKIAEDALQQVKMKPGQAAESRATAEGILSGVRGITDDARQAARELDKVRLTERQGAESKLAAAEIDSGLNRISRNADQAKRKLAEVRILGGVPGRSGVGVGPFGSGFGRVGVLGAAIGAGVLTAPAAAPGAAGLLAAIPTLAFGAAGAVGTLALAFKGVGKAIGGDKKAFDDLGPSAQKFVLTVRSLDGWFDKLKQTAAGSLFPGLTTGLKAAMSPGTVGAITKAVSQMGGALGQAGAQWGRYFGSPKFQQLLGPLMQAGARNFVTLSSAMLHLFDALGVLGRAAIPFTNWITKGIDAGARFASSWMRAKEASGALGRGLNEAKSSLQLVGGLFASLLRAVGSLGRALYPVSKIAVKQLTDGLNALARIIDRNKQTIREIVGGALAALVSTVKIAAPIVGSLGRALNRVVHAMGGWKTAFQIVIGGFLASKFFGLSRSIRAVGTASAIAGAEGGVGGLLGKLTRLKALGPISVVIGLSVIPPNKKGQTALDRYGLGFLGKLPIIGSAEQQAARLGEKAGTAFDHLLGVDSPAEEDAKNQRAWKTLVRHAIKRNDSLDRLQSLLRAVGLPSVTAPQYAKLRDAYEASLPAVEGWMPSTTKPKSKPVDSSFGTPPPFTKNVPKPRKPAVIPAGASHAEALAAANASRASVLGNSGATAKEYLTAELGDLQKADRLLEAKYKASTGADRTRLFAAMTSVENKIRTVRDRIRKAIVDDRGDRLKLALDQAKLSVENATVGSAAYDKAVAAEAKALRAEIAYWDRRAHNVKLSRAARDKAVREELGYKKELKALLKPDAAKTDANIAQFISSFADITQAFAPNAWPVAPGSGQTDTHLYEVKHELRHQTKILREIHSATRFPASAYEAASVMAVAG